MNSLTPLMPNFSGSYAADDVQLLLEQIEMPHTDIATKERLIQTCEKHYSEMISLESAPSSLHHNVFIQAQHDGAARVAHDIQSLAMALSEVMPRPIVLVSLVRAGLPVGVLLKHALTDMGQTVFHYGVSIVRDRGLDPVAYAHIRAQHAFSQLVFVDGWTGKGAISRQLTQSITQDPDFDGVTRLVTLADAGGCAWLAASGDDWLIPSGILGSTISGLISRSIYRPNQLHGYVLYEHLRDVDQSQNWINTINNIRRHDLKHSNITPAIWTESERKVQQQQARKAMDWVSTQYQVDNINRIKPSIAEATRVLMRRMPERVLLRNKDDQRTRLLRHLAKLNNAPVEIVGDVIAPYHAISIIQKKRLDDA